MPHYLSDEELRRTAPAEVASFKSPVPTQIVSNGEFNPLPQTREQQRVEARIKELADDLGRRHGMRSEEHTSELQSRLHLVCRLLLEKKKKKLILRYKYKQGHQQNRLVAQRP